MSYTKKCLTGLVTASLLTAGSCLWAQQANPRSSTKGKPPTKVATTPQAAAVEVKFPVKNQAAKALASKGLGAMKAQQFEVAERELYQALMLEPENEDLANAYSRCLKDVDFAAYQAAQKQEPDRDKLRKLSEEKGESLHAPVREAYRKLIASAPGNATYPYILGSIFYRYKPEEGQYLAKALAVDPKFVPAHIAFSDFKYRHGEISESLAHAKAAVDLKPGDKDAIGNYLSVLSNTDCAQAVKVSQEIVARSPKSEAALDAYWILLSDQVEPGKTIELLEPVLRSFSGSDNWKFDLMMTRLFHAYVSVDVAKALSFATQMSKGVKSDDFGDWKRNLAYAQALTEAKDLMAKGDFKTALQTLQKAKAGYASDPAVLPLMKAQASEAAGDTNGAYSVLVETLAKTPNAKLRAALRTYGAKLDKSEKQQDDDIWARRLKDATVFKDFEFKKFGSEETVKLSSLRGKVVFLNFWYPG